MTSSEEGEDYGSVDFASMVTAPHRATCAHWETQTLPTTRTPHIRPRPGRRRPFISPTTTFHLFLLAPLLLSLLSNPAFAIKTPKSELRRPRLEGRENGILFDAHPIPEPHLYRRQSDAEPSTSRQAARTTSSDVRATSSAAGAASTEDSASASTSTSSDSSSTGIETAPTPSNSALPKAFDGGLGTNYTQPSCPNFLKEMISNDTFTSCLPFSLLLQVCCCSFHAHECPKPMLMNEIQNSMSFFTSSRTPDGLDPVLSASCNIVLSACSSLMSSYALTLRSNSGCSEDYNRQNPTVRQAYNGLLAYDILYRASCLKAQPSAQNNQSSDYCYSDAVTNTSSPTNSYVYYLPLGVNLPAGSMPTCSQCLKDTMAMFAATASNKTQPITLTYIDAARMVNLQCGPNFVNQSVPGASSSSSGARATPSAMGLGWTGLIIAVVGVMQILDTL